MPVFRRLVSAAAQSTYSFAPGIGHVRAPLRRFGVEVSHRTNTGSRRDLLIRIPTRSKKVSNSARLRMGEKYIPTTTDSLHLAAARALSLPWKERRVRGYRRRDRANRISDLVSSVIGNVIKLSRDRYPARPHSVIACMNKSCALTEV